jgi:hypothetical protein
MTLGPAGEGCRQVQTRDESSNNGPRLAFGSLAMTGYPEVTVFSLVQNVVCPSTNRHDPCTTGSLFLCRDRLTQACMTDHGQGSSSLFQRLLPNRRQTARNRAVADFPEARFWIVSAFADNSPGQ